MLLSPERGEKSFSIYINKIPDCTQQDISGIVVLGSGILQKDLPSAATQIRLHGFTELLKYDEKNCTSCSKKLALIFSGGITNPAVQQSEAQAMFHFERYLYSSSSGKVKYQLLLEEKSQNTHENALYTKELFDKYGYRKNIALVTSSYHMRRAKGAFQAQGFTVCPVPITSVNLQSTEQFSWQNAANSAVILHEYGGLIYYGIKGWL